MAISTPTVMGITKRSISSSGSGLSFSRWMAPRGRAVIQPAVIQPACGASPLPYDGACNITLSGRKVAISDAQISLPLRLARPGSAGFEAIKGSDRVPLGGAAG